MAKHIKGMGVFHSRKELQDNVAKLSKVTPRLTQKQMAERCEVSESTINSILTNKFVDAIKPEVNLTKKLNELWRIR
jgi:DNA-binding XRE family transcriptional regulator